MSDILDSVRTEALFFDRALRWADGRKSAGDEMCVWWAVDELREASTRLDKAHTNMHLHLFELLKQSHDLLERSHEQTSEALALAQLSRLDFVEICEAVRIAAKRAGIISLRLELDRLHRNGDGDGHANGNGNGDGPS